MRGSAGSKGLIRNDFQAPATRKDPSSGPLRGPPSPRRGEGIAILTPRFEPSGDAMFHPAAHPGKSDRMSVRTIRKRVKTGQQPDKTRTQAALKADVCDRADAGRKGRRRRSTGTENCHNPHQFRDLNPSPGRTRLLARRPHHSGRAPEFSQAFSDGKQRQTASGNRHRIFVMLSSPVRGVSKHAGRRPLNRPDVETACGLRHAVCDRYSD